MNVLHRRVQTYVLSQHGLVVDSLAHGLVVPARPEAATSVVKVQISYVLGVVIQRVHNRPIRHLKRTDQAILPMHKKRKQKGAQNT